MFCPRSPYASACSMAQTGVLDRQRVFEPAVDVAFRGTDGVGGNDHAFDHLMGIAFHDRAVHVGAGVPFIGVADDIPGLSPSPPAGFPLDAGGKPPAAAAAKPGKFHLGDHLLRGHPREHLGQRRIAATADIVFYVGDEVDPGGVENQPFLPGKEGDLALVNDLLARQRVDVQEVVQDLSAEHGPFHDFRHPVTCHARVKDIFRLDHHDRSLGAKAVAAGGFDHIVRGEVPAFQVLLKGADQFLTALRMARCPGTDADPFLEPPAPGGGFLAQGFQLLDAIQAVHGFVLDLFLRANLFGKLADLIGSDFGMGYAVNHHYRGRGACSYTVDGFQRHGQIFGGISRPQMEVLGQPVEQARRSLNVAGCSRAHVHDDAPPGFEAEDFEESGHAVYLADGHHQTLGDATKALFGQVVIAVVDVEHDLEQGSRFWSPVINDGIDILLIVLHALPPSVHFSPFTTLSI